MRGLWGASQEQAFITQHSADCPGCSGALAVASPIKGRQSVALVVRAAGVALAACLCTARGVSRAAVLQEPYAGAAREKARNEGGAPAPSPRCEAPVAASGAMRAQSLRTVPTFGPKAQSNVEGERGERGERGARRKGPRKNAPAGPMSLRHRGAICRIDAEIDVVAEKSETRDRPVVQLLRSRERGQLDTHALAVAPGQAAASAGHTEERRTGAAPWAGDRVAKRKKPNATRLRRLAVRDR